MSEPTVVLVHGAFADASGFTGVIRELQSGGHAVIAPPNPLRSLASDAAALSAVVKAIDGPVLLVGHSYGGAVITQASAGLDNVTGLVYLAAFGLDVGESCASVQDPFPPSMLASTSRPTPYDAPGAPQGPDLYIAKEQFRETFCADVPVDLADVMFATQRPLSLAALTENATAAGVEDQALLVPGVRARQRYPARRGAIHGRTHGRRRRIDQRVAHRVHRQPGAGGQLHRQGRRRLTRG
jgi:pimeloyl-ACP methyl ester carboxylesterase